MVLIFRACLVGALLTVLNLTIYELSYAQSGPSREKCTCINGADRNGAQVVNAAACLRDQVGQWCDIYLAATENSAEHQTIIGAFSQARGNPRPSLLRTLRILFDQYADAQNRAGTLSPDRMGAEKAALEKAIETSISELDKCVAGFLDRERVATENSLLSCSVGSESGWLRINIAKPNGTLTFLFAPIKR